MGHWLVSLTSHISHQQGLHGATSWITSMSLILSHQHMVNQAKSKSRVALLHPRSAKVSTIYHTRTSTDQFLAHISTIISFTKSWLLPWSGQANLPSQQHIIWCWTAYFWNSTSEFIWRSRTCWQCTIFSRCLSTLSIAPVDFYAQHFSKLSEKSDGHAKDIWVWFWPIESKESCTPLGSDELTLT